MASRMGCLGVKAALCLGLGLLATTVGAATTTAGSGSSTGTATAAATTHTVVVAATAHSFEPNEITANVGDTILFEFFTGNHSVVRAEYKSPCIPYENLGRGRVGFFSGFQPVEGVLPENGPKYALQVNSSDPVFFYCSAPGSCVPNSMIGVINPNATQTLANQQLFVQNSTYQLSPGETPPSESTPSPSPSPAPSAGAGGGLSKGAIAGISIGAVVVIALAAFTFYLCGRNRSLASVVRYSQPPRSKHPSSAPPPVAYAPATPQPQAPYAPSYSDNLSPKPSVMGSPSPNANYHDSWQSQPPSMNGGSPGFVAPYPAQPSPGHAPWSPGGFAPQQVQYSAVPQQSGAYHQEMSTGQEHSMTPSASPGPYGHPHDSYMSAQSYQSRTISPPPLAPIPQHSQLVHHELDAAPTMPPTSPPPDYMGRSFSFGPAGHPGEAPGVEKVLRD